ncbi:MAG TPA: hypothetical protein VF635_05765 [Propionibacteriaceae bacterium]
MMNRRRQQAAIVVVALVAVTVLPACGEAASSGGPPAVVAPDEQDLLGRWTDAMGQVLPDGTSASKGILVVSTSAGSTTCTEDGTVFLQLSWPPGSEVDLFSGEGDDKSAPQFIRDTTGSAMETVGTSDLDRPCRPPQSRPVSSGEATR